MRSTCDEDGWTMVKKRRIKSTVPVAENGKRRGKRGGKKIRKAVEDAQRGRDESLVEESIRRNLLELVDSDEEENEIAQPSPSFEYVEVTGLAKEPGRDRKILRLRSIPPGFTSFLKWTEISNLVGRGYSVQIVVGSDRKEWWI